MPINPLMLSEGSCTQLKVEVCQIQLNKMQMWFIQDQSVKTENIEKDEIIKYLLNLND